MKFRKNPVVIDAVQITDSTFDAPHPNPEHVHGVIYDPVKREVRIPTLEGEMTGKVGDWIITGIKGEHYPCKPDIFAATYDRAADADDSYQGVRMRAKLIVDSTTRYQWLGEEVNSFSDAIPVANLLMQVSNPALLGRLNPGDSFYLDFTPAK